MGALSLAGGHSVIPSGVMLQLPEPLPTLSIEYTLFRLRCTLLGQRTTYAPCSPADLRPVARVRDGRPRPLHCLRSM
jgi:hypothetical protein